MSDLCTYDYELGDSVFDSTNDDHLVIGVSIEGLNEAASIGDRYMKNWEETSVFSGEPSFFVTNQIYGWSDLGDFEDIDGMFSNGSSTFGIGDICEEEELSCFLSSHDFDGFEAEPMSASEFPSSDSSPFANVLGHCENSTPNCTVNHSNAVKAFYLISGSQSSDCTMSANAVGNTIFKDGIETTSRYKSGFKSNDQTHIKMEQQLMHHKQSSKRKRKDFYLENVNGSDHTVTSPSETASYDHLQNHVPFKDSNFDHRHSNQFSKTVMPSSDNLDNNDLVCFSAKEFSFIPDQVKPSDRSYQLSFEAPDDKLVSLPEGQGHHHFSYKSDSTCMNIQEQSTTQQSLPNEETFHGGSGFCDISSEASSFQSLQQIMGKLDKRTRLSLRDGLYRLARNAERRHTLATLNDCSDDIDGESGFQMTEGKSNVFVNIEAGTNPVDRSIAHLLFYKL